MQASHFGAVHWLNRVICLTQADDDTLNVRHTQNEMCIDKFTQSGSLFTIKYQ